MADFDASRIEETIALAIEYLDDRRVPLPAAHDLCLAIELLMLRVDRANDCALRATDIAAAVTAAKIRQREEETRCARRYLWLRDSVKASVDGWIGDRWVEFPSAADADAAVDAAMREGD